MEEIFREYACSPNPSYKFIARDFLGGGLKVMNRAKGEIIEAEIVDVETRALTVKGLVKKLQRANIRDGVPKIFLATRRKIFGKRVGGFVYNIEGTISSIAGHATIHKAPCDFSVPTIQVFTGTNLSEFLKQAKLLIKIGEVIGRGYSINKITDEYDGSEVDEIREYLSKNQFRIAKRGENTFIVDLEKRDQDLPYAPLLWDVTKFSATYIDNSALPFPDIFPCRLLEKFTKVLVVPEHSRLMQVIKNYQKRERRQEKDIGGTIIEEKGD